LIETTVLTKVESTLGALGYRPKAVEIQRPAINAAAATWARCEPVQNNCKNAKSENNSQIGKAQSSNAKKQHSTKHNRSNEADNLARNRPASDYI
jgi:hypothetical protein